MASLDNNLLDDPLVADGNQTFVGGQYSSVPANTVPQNAFSEAKNMDFDALGRLLTRRGAKSVIGNVFDDVWENATTNWESITAVWGTSIPSNSNVHGLFFFDTYSAEYMIVAVANGSTRSLYQGTENAAYSEISGSSFTQNIVYFAQLNNRLYYCDGDIALKYIDSAVANQTITAGKVTSITITEKGLGYNAVPAITFTHNGGAAGAATAVLGYGGRVVSATVTAAGSGYSATTPPTIAFAAAPAGGTTATGTVNISQTPSKPKYLVSHTNRLFCVSADTSIPPDTLYASNILDGESWDLAGGSIRVGGDGDPITGLFSWFGYNLLVFKQRSVWVVVADPLQAPSQWTITLVNNRIGCVGHKTIQAVGADVMFMSRTGVRSISQIQAGTQTDVGLPLSEPIKDEIDDLDFTYSEYFCSSYYSNRYMLGVVTNGNTRPNRVLVFNQMFRSWVGYWTGWNPMDFVVTAFSGKIRLSFADNTGQVWTWDDYTPVSSQTGSEYRDGINDYESFVISRGYQNGDPLVKKRGYTVQIETDNTLNADTVTAYFSYALEESGSFTSLNSSISIASESNQTPLGWNLIPVGKYRTIQFKFGTNRLRCALNGLAVAAFPDTITPTIT